MRNRLLYYLMAAGVAVIIALNLTILWEGQQRTLPRRPGDPVDNFALYDHAGNLQELYYYSDVNAVVLIVHGNGCPIMRKSLPYINHLVGAFRDRGVVFLMINSNPQDDRRAIAEEAAEYQVGIPILKDTSQVVGESLGITRTAEAFLIDPADWRIVYRGAISDRLNYEGERYEAGRTYLRNALEAFLNNEAIAIRKTLPRGCLVNIPKEQPEAVYTQDVAPILQKKCMSCHVEGGIAPWSMDGYEKVRGWGPMIREVVRTKRMPPWHADPLHGNFRNDISLTSDEVKTLVHWVEQHFPRGEGADPLSGKKVAQADPWSLGDPDMVFQLEKAQVIPAAGADEFRFINADKPIEKDIWIKAVDIKPGNLRVVHHGNLVVKWPDSVADISDAAPEELYRTAGMDMENGSIVAGYAPGGGPFEMPEGTGIFVPKGSVLEFRLHYITTGKEETDLTQAAVYVHTSPPPKSFSVETINNRNIRIPAGDKNYRRVAATTFEEDVLLTALQPHMHYRGKSMKFIIEYPDGRQETALSVPDYRFHWQRRYVLKEPKRIPKGTTVFLVGYFDNSAQNSDNPDPGQEVVYGPYSHTEMFQGILFYIPQ